MVLSKLGHENICTEEDFAHSSLTPAISTAWQKTIFGGSGGQDRFHLKAGR